MLLIDSDKALNVEQKLCESISYPSHPEWNWIKLWMTKVFLPWLDYAWEYFSKSYYINFDCYSNGDGMLPLNTNHCMA